MDKINKKLLLIGIGTTIIFTFIFSFLFLKLKGTKKEIKETGKEQITKKKIIEECKINTAYLYPDKITILENVFKTSYKNIKLKTYNDNKDNNVASCILNSKDKVIIQILNKPGYLLRDYFKYALTNKGNNYSLLVTDIDFKKIRSYINVIKLGNDLENKYLYFKDDPEIISFFNLLKKVNQNLVLGLNLKTEKIEGFKRIKFSDLIEKFGDNVIVTNTKIIIKLLPSDFKILEQKLKDLKMENKLKTIKNLERISNIYQNTIVYKGKYLILQNINNLIKNIEQKNTK